jgi:hypothetical protein
MAIIQIEIRLGRLHQIVYKDSRHYVYADCHTSSALHGALLVARILAVSGFATQKLGWNIRRRQRRGLHAELWLLCAGEL